VAETSEPATASHQSNRLGFALTRRDGAGLSFVALFVFFYLSPALKDGPSFVPADLGRGLSLLTQLQTPFAPPHNNINGDIVDQAVPWNTLSYELVHHGLFPMWNALSGNGLPHFLNFESAVLALPSLVGYLVPISISFLVTVAMKLLIAGFGTYLACRLLGTGALSATLGALTYMFSGAFSGWLGWSISGVYCWAGFILYACVLTYRVRDRVFPVALLAVVAAFSIYAGFPEGEVLLAATFVFFGLVVLVASALLRVRIDWWAGVRLGIGLAAGAALSSPLWLGGTSVLTSSARKGEINATGIPLHAALSLFAQGYNGLPIKGSVFFLPVGNYYETAAYVGVIALCLAIVALICAWRRPVVIGAFFSAAGAFLLVYRIGSGGPIQHLVIKLGLGALAVQRELSMLEFFLAILAAFGAEVLCRRLAETRVRVTLVGSVALIGLVIALLWTRIGQAGSTVSCLDQSLSAATCRSLRRSSLIWPSATLIGLALVIGVALVVRRKHASRLFMGSLVGGQASFLLFAGVGINSYAPSAYPVTKNVATVQGIVKSAIVGLDSGNETCPPQVSASCGVRGWAGIGFYPEINIGYGIDQLGTHDPITPQAYFDAWPVENAGQGIGGVNLFSPNVNTVALAKTYGVSYVLVSPHQPMPAGMVPVAHLSTNAGIETLVHVPGVSRFSFTSDADHVRSSTQAPSSYRLVVDAPVASVLRASVTDVPGWHAEANGRALSITRAPGDLIALQVPAGTSTIELSYHPRTVEIGAFGALIAAVALGAAGAFNTVRKRRRLSPDEE
jgi:hypothetical protein